MNWQTLPYLIPYLISLVISTRVGIYAWRHYGGNGIAQFALMASWPRLHGRWTMCLN